MLDPNAEEAKRKMLFPKQIHDFLENKLIFE